MEDFAARHLHHTKCLSWHCLQAYRCTNCYAQIELEGCQKSLAAARAHVGRLQRGAAAAATSTTAHSAHARALAEERAGRAAAEGALAAARTTAAAKAELVKGLKSRVRPPLSNPQSIE